jgi:hypothetical protein
MDNEFWALPCLLIGGLLGALVGALVGRSRSVQGQSG